jgi:hypothetical protein
LRLAPRSRVSMIGAALGSRQTLSN